MVGNIIIDENLLARLRRENPEIAALIETEGRPENDRFAQGPVATEQVFYRGPHTEFRELRNNHMVPGINNVIQRLGRNRQMMSNYQIREFELIGDVDIDIFTDKIRDTINALEENNITPINHITVFYGEQPISFSLTRKNVNNVVASILSEDIDEVAQGSDRNVGVLGSRPLNTRRFWIHITIAQGQGRRGKCESLYYVTKEPRKQTSNCLVNCIAHFAKRRVTNEDTEEIIKILGVSTLDIPLTAVDHAQKLAKYFNVEICILDDRRNTQYTEKYAKFDIIYDKPVILSGKDTCGNKIIYFDNHFAIHVKNRAIESILTDAFIQGNDEDSFEDSIERLISENGKKTLFFFDFECVGDHELGTTIPYAWCLKECDENGKVIESWVDVDIPSHAVGQRLVDLLERLHAKRPHETKILVGYNNSRYDNYLLLQYAAYAKDMLFAGNKILIGEIEGFWVFDLCRHLNTSLAKAAKAFGCKSQKLGFDHNIVQSAYDEGKFESWINENKTQLLEYLEADVYTTAELFFKTQKAIKEAVNIDFMDFPTVGTLAYKLLQKHCRKNNIALPVVDAKRDKIIRSSSNGGRTQVFRREHIEKKVSRCDVTSLYPTVLLNTLVNNNNSSDPIWIPGARYPVGKPVDTKEYVPNKIGYYKVTICRQPDLTLVPGRNEDGTLNWDDNESRTRWLSSVRIDALRSMGVSVEVHNGFYWEKDTLKMFDYLAKLRDAKLHQDKLKDEKSKDYNPVLRDFYKLMLNSTAGKTGQRNFSEHRELITSTSGMQKFEKRTNNSVFTIVNEYFTIGYGEKKRVRVKMPSVINSLVYDYSQVAMHRHVLSPCITRIMTDTDSVMLETSEFEKIKKNLPMGDAFGYLKEELEDKLKSNELGPYAVVLNKKCYITYALKQDGTPRILETKFKGIGKNDKIIPKDMNIKEISQMSHASQHELYCSQERTLDLDVYIEMLEGNNVSFLCSRIASSSKTLRLSHGYIVKSFKNIC